MGPQYCRISEQSDLVWLLHMLAHLEITHLQLAYGNHLTYDITISNMGYTLVCLFVCLFVSTFIALEG